MNSSDGTTITTRRLTLAPLRIEDADEMARVLDSEALHEFIGGRPLTIAALRERYARLTAGSTDPDEVWLNWIVRRRSDSQAVGTVQATLDARDGHTTAHAAWVIGVEYQNHGFASEAARALVAWLREQGAESVVARIHPDHRASALVALRAGRQPTDEHEDGEQLWRTSGQVGCAPDAWRLLGNRGRQRGWAPTRGVGDELPYRRANAGRPAHRSHRRDYPVLLASVLLGWPSLVDVEHGLAADSAFQEGVERRSGLSP